MRNQLINFREERDLGQKINATFSFIRKNLKSIAWNLLLIVVPFALLGGIFSGISQYRMLTVNRDYTQFNSWGAFDFAKQITSFHYVLSLFFIVVSFVLVSLLVCAYIVEYMDNDGNVEPAALRERIKSNFFSVFFSTFGVFLLVMLGMVILVVPGIYLSVAFSLYIIVMVREEVGFVEGLERCVALVKGNWWSTFGLIMVIGIIQYVFQFITSAPTLILNVLFVAKIPGGDNQVLLIAANSLSVIGAILFYSLSIIAIAFQYFNLVEVKEGVGYIAMADQIGAVQVETETEEDAF